VNVNGQKVIGGFFSSLFGTQEACGHLASLFRIKGISQANMFQSLRYISLSQEIGHHDIAKVH
jgi:hypothetical protein